MDPEELRIGDRERDEAIGWLREHHSTGRLDVAEFDDRMSRALEARTKRELEVLFLDLPEPKPSGSVTPGPYAGPNPQEIPGYGAPTPPTYGAEDPYAGPYAPTPYGAGQFDSGYQPSPYTPQAGGPPQPTPPTPWYAQWWMLFVAIGFSAVTGARLGWLIPLMALWIWVIYPQIVRSRTALPSAPPRELTFAEREEILATVRSGQKILAVKRYREMTGADLRTAKETVEAMGRQIGY